MVVAEEIGLGEVCEENTTVCSQGLGLYQPGPAEWVGRPMQYIHQSHRCIAATGELLATNPVEYVLRSKY